MGINPDAAIPSLAGRQDRSGKIVFREMKSWNNFIMNRPNLTHLLFLLKH